MSRLAGRPVGRGVGVGLVAVAVGAPVVPLLLWAGAGQFRYPALLPQFSSRGLGLLTDPAVLRALGTSAVIAVAVAALATGIGTAAGRALADRFPGRPVVGLLLLLPAVVPTLATTLGIQVVFLHYGLADTAAGVVAVQLVPTVPYVSLLMAATFADLDPDLADQARALGAGPVRRTLLVTLPAVGPALAVAALLAFLISWSEYLLTLLIGGAAVTTLPLLLFATIASADLPAAAAVALLIAAPPLLLVALTTRYLTGRSPAGVGIGAR